jgi:hypothetical protein
MLAPMSIWGKLGGAAAGLVVGGPIGALVGALAGHVLIDVPSTEGGLVAPADPGVAFTIAMIALSAKMAKADGIVTRDEIEAFDRLFRVPADERANVHRVFNLARRDTAGYEAYASQIAGLYRGNPAVLEDIMDGLFESRRPTVCCIRVSPRFSSAWRRSSALRPMSTAASALPTSAMPPIPMSFSASRSTRAKKRSAAPIAGWCGRITPTA